MGYSALAILLLASQSVAMSQGIPQTPLPMRTVLPEMNKRAKTLAKDHKELRDYYQVIDHGTDWLEQRLREDDPAEYRLQLTIDDYLLEKALENPDDAPAVMKSVAEDVELKSKDCWKFGHGRRVTVEIRTVKGGSEDSGWQIFYRWLPASNLQMQVMELSFPDPSSPSLLDLPVGMYAIHVEKRDDSGVLLKSNILVIPVGMENKTAWKVQIP
jgi:hypothetical protein